jgi:pyridoxine kinase
MPSLKEAVSVLHGRYGVPHVVITSVSSISAEDASSKTMAVVGSTMTSTAVPRLFQIIFPSIDAFFSGTGDMFAALMVVRMREAVYRASGLRDLPSWLSPDDVPAVDLPLAQAAEKVLASMHEVLTKTSEAMNAELKQTAKPLDGAKESDDSKRLRLVKSRASELRLVRNLDALKHPKTAFRAVKM